MTFLQRSFFYLAFADFAHTQEITIIKGKFALEFVNIEYPEYRRSEDEGAGRLIAILRGRQRALSNTPVYLRVWPLKTSPIWDAGGRQVYSRGILRLGSGLAIAGGLYGKNDREFWVIIKAFVVHGLGGARLKRKGIVKLNKARWVNERLTSIIL